MIQIDCFALFLASFLLMVLPLEWILSVFFAAVFHELCHIGTILLLGGKVSGIHIRAGGTVIQAEISGIGRELMAALAGPAGSLLLLCLLRIAPRAAICGCIQAAVNLLPVYPLDGGRIAVCCLRKLCPNQAYAIMKVVEACSAVMIFTVLIAALHSHSQRIVPFGLTLLFLVKVILRKRPCKRSQIRVQ